MKENSKKLGIIAVVLIFILIATNGILFKMYITADNKLDDIYAVTGRDGNSTNLAGLGIIDFMDSYNCSSIHYISVVNKGEQIKKLNCGYEDCSSGRCSYEQFNLID
jgi:hypothetical protein